MNHHQLFKNYPVLPIVNQATIEEALVIAEAFLEADLYLMEMTLRTETAKKGLLEVRKKFPDLVLGVGSILSKDQMQWAFDAGMDFTVSPREDSLWKWSKIKNSFHLELSPSELLKSIKAGCKHPKFFPLNQQEASLASNLYCSLPKCQCHLPANWWNWKEKVSHYLDLPEVQIVGSSWITPQTHIANKDAKKITELAKASLLHANTKS